MHKYVAKEKNFINVNRKFGYVFFTSWSSDGDICDIFEVAIDHLLQDNDYFKWYNEWCLQPEPWTNKVKSVDLDLNH